MTHWRDTYPITRCDASNLQWTEDCWNAFAKVLRCSRAYNMPGSKVGEARYRDISLHRFGSHCEQGGSVVTETKICAMVSRCYQGSPSGYEVRGNLLRI